MTTQEKVLIRFHKWMRQERWEYHQDGLYWYKLEYESQWPPKQGNMCDEDELIEKFKVYCMEN